MIKKISNASIDALKKKSYLPDSPTAQGYKPAQIKKALTSAITDDQNSVVAEINRIVDELNTRGFVAGTVNFTIESGQKGENGSVTVKDNGVSGVEIKVVCPYGTDEEEVQRLIDEAIACKLNAADIVDSLDSEEPNKPLSARQGAALKGLIDKIQQLLSSDDSMLDTVQEIVEYIKHNKSLIDSVSTNKIDKSDIVDSLDSEEPNKPLSARQGAALKGLIDKIQQLLSSDDSMLDTVQEIVEYIKHNKSLIDSVSTNKIDKSDIVDKLTADEKKPLSARQGLMLSNKINEFRLHYDEHIKQESEFQQKFARVLFPKRDTSWGDSSAYYDDYRASLEEQMLELGLSDENGIRSFNHIGIGFFKKNKRNGNQIIIGHNCAAGGNSVRITVGKEDVDAGGNTVSIGANIENRSLYSVVIGCDNRAGGVDSDFEGGEVVIGQNCAANKGGIAIGRYAVSKKLHGISIGTGTKGDAFVELGSFLPGGSGVIFSVCGVPMLLPDGNGGAYIPTGLIDFSPFVSDAYEPNSLRALSANKGKELNDKITVIQALLKSNDSMLDTVQEIVEYIKNNKSLIDSVVTNKVNKEDIIDNLISNVSDKPLSAAQGYILKTLIDAIPGWAKAAQKPTYTVDEIGAEPAFSKNSAFNKDFGQSEGTVCEGSDPRLSDSRQASDVPDYVKAITQEDILKWRNPETSYSGLSDKPKINGVTIDGDVSLSDLHISASFGPEEGQSLSTIYFNKNVSIEKMSAFLSALTPSIATGLTGSAEISVVFETTEYQGVYSIDLSKFGGSGHALSICNASFAEDGVTPIFSVLNIVFVSEYSEINQAIIQNFYAGFTYTNAGWQDISSFGCISSEIYSIVPKNPELKNKVSAFIGTDTKLWDILSMLN